MRSEVGAASVGRSNSSFPLLLLLGTALLVMPAGPGGPVESSPFTLFAQEVRPSQTPAALYAQGVEDLEKKRYEQAVAVFRAALALDPTLVPARYDLGVARFALGRFDQARPEFEEVLRRKPQHLFARYFLARVHLSEGELDAAIRGFMSLPPEKPIADELYYLGTAYFRKGDLHAALRVLNRGAAWNPGDYRIHLLLARAYQKAGQNVRAEKHHAISEQIRETYRKKSREILECGNALDVKVFEAAYERCRQLLDGDDSTKLVSLGVLLAERQHFEEALPPLVKAARIDPENFEPHFNLGLTYFRMKKYREAREPLERAVLLRLASFDAAALLGSSLFALGEDHAAVAALRRAHALRPTDEKVKTMLFEQLRIIARHALAGKNYKESVHFFEEALVLNPDAAELHLQLAEAYSALGDSARAEREKQAFQKFSARPR